MKEAIGIFVGLLIGAGCRWFGVPSPAPPQLIGALLVMSMTVGYLLTDKWLTPEQPSPTPAAAKAQATPENRPGDVNHGPHGTIIERTNQATPENRPGDVNPTSPREP